MIIVMGVSGTGKSTIGKLLADALAIPFYDADDFHSDHNRSRMAKGQPLTDQDRMPWLINLKQRISRWTKSGDAVLACSALKSEYRKILESGTNKTLTWVHLHGDEVLIRARLLDRHNHFFNPSLLKSQFDDLEEPENAIKINVNQSPQQILAEILNKMKTKATFGIIGMGVMGQNLALNIANNGTKLSVYNRHIPGKEEDVAQSFARQHPTLAMQGFDDLSEFVDSLDSPRNILLMVQAGIAVDETIESLIPLLDPDDLIIDGGNSNYLDTGRRDYFLSQHQIPFVGAGISGGEEGARKGPSIMPGGSQIAYQRVGDLFNQIAAKDQNGNPCCAYIGPEGSGHFVKMVHNGIEYAEMQLLAEVYELLRNGLEMMPSAIADTLHSWKTLDLDSYLLGITIDILRKEEDNVLLLDKILDAASQKGTGGWSTEAAIKLGVPLNTISDAVMARNISARKALRTQANEVYGDSKKIIKNDKEQFTQAIREAYAAARIINHAIGFDMILEASAQYNWSLNLSEIARIWTNGCIIRSDLMVKAIEYFKTCDHLLLHPDCVKSLTHQQPLLAEVVGVALTHGIPVPVLSSATNFLLGYTNGRSSANLIQAQRDYFGAHTYQRVDKPLSESFHTQWTGS